MSDHNERPWSEATMSLINDITKEIKFKAFDPDWFLLRQRLEGVDVLQQRITDLEALLRDIYKWRAFFRTDLTRDIFERLEKWGRENNL